MENILLLFLVGGGGGGGGVRNNWVFIAVTLCGTCNLFYNIL